MLIKRILSFVISLFIWIAISGQDKMKTGIIYGSDIAFVLTAPEGWILDNTSAVNQGFFAVFYREGEAWKDAETVMYANIASYQNTPDTTLDLLISYDIGNFKNRYPDIDITDTQDIKIRANLNAKVKYLSGKSYGNYEAMAYIDETKAGVIIVLSSRTKEGFDKSLIAFENLVKSYMLISNHVKIEVKDK